MLGGSARGGPAGRKRARRQLHPRGRFEDRRQQRRARRTGGGGGAWGAPAPSFLPPSSHPREGIPRREGVPRGNARRPVPPLEGSERACRLPAGSASLSPARPPTAQSLRADAAKGLEAPRRAMVRRPPRCSGRLAVMLLALLRCLRAGHGAPTLAQPAQVRFAAQTFRHHLLWELPAARPHDGVLFFEVQYRRYMEVKWIPAANCTRIARCACDLSAQTWDPQQNYYARVRTLAGNQTSDWTLSPRFDPKDAALWLAGMSLSLEGNTIHVSLRLPTSRERNITYEDVYPTWREFHAHIRRVSDGAKFVHVDHNPEFCLPPLSWGEQYCVSVKPHVASRSNPAQLTKEQCLAIPPMEGGTRSMVFSILGMALLSLGVLGALGMALACAYVRKSRETPALLKSFLERRSPCVLDGLLALETRDVILCLEADSTQQLSMGTTTGRANTHSTAAAPPSPKRSCWLAALLAEGKQEGLGHRDSMDSSTDSGICLQDSPSGSLSHLLSCRRLSLGGSSSEEEEEEEGEGAQQGSSGGHRPPPPPGEEQLLHTAEEGDTDTEEKLEPVVEPAPQAHFSGYQKQRGGPLEAVSCAWPPPDTEEGAPSQPGRTTGYLKQLSFVGPCRLGDTGITQDLLVRMEQGPLHWPAHLPLDGRGPLGVLPEFPQTLLALGFFGPTPLSPSTPSLSCAPEHTPGPQTALTARHLDCPPIT
ncbi:interleukin-10 receptor subunit alpha [Hemicordylus capensis]|uniref:interleukin-10 receptor subunit alpha n=1 Tax=Hemicordylus capensis TaxID=884348 RepID=UPI002303E38C|nr:interleukin-10 receptor subunit alpha [Hemicordylus capensis]